MDWLKFYLFLLIWVFSVSEALGNSTALQPTECVPGQSIPPPDECNKCVCFDGRIHCTHLLCSSNTNTVPGFECVYDTDIPPPDECNTCVCHEGRIACTNLICIPDKTCIDGESYPAPDECNECRCDKGHVVCTNEKCLQTPLIPECVDGQEFRTHSNCIECNCVGGQIKCVNTCAEKPNTRMNKECEMGQLIPRPDKCNACICHKGEKLCSDSPCYKAINVEDTECDISPDIPVDYCNECACINGRWTCFSTICIRGATCVENEQIPGPDECNLCQCYEGHIICTNYDCKLVGPGGLFGKSDSSMSELELPEHCEEDDYIPPPPPPNDCNRCTCVDHRVFCTMEHCVDTVGDTTEILNRQNDQNDKLDVFDKKILMDPFLDMFNKKYDKAPTKLVHTHAYNGFQQEIKVHANHLNQDVNELIRALATSLDNPALVYMSEQIKSPSNGNIQFAAKIEGSTDLPDIQLSHSLSSFITSGSRSNETILVIPPEKETSPTPNYQKQHIGITPYNGESINLTFVQKNQDYISSNPSTIISTIEQYNSYHNPTEYDQPDFYTISPTSSVRNTDLTDDFILPVLPINPIPNNLNEAKESYTPHTRDDEQNEPNPSSINSPLKILPLNQTENTTPVSTNFTAFTPINNPGQHPSPNDVENQYIPTQSNPNTTIYHDNQNEPSPNFNNQENPNNLYPTVFNQSATTPSSNQNMLPDSNYKPPHHHHQFNTNPNYQDNPTQTVFNPYEEQPVSISDDKGNQNNPQHPAIYNNHPFNSHPPEFSPGKNRHIPFSSTSYNTLKPFHLPQMSLQPNQEKPKFVPDNTNSPYDLPHSKFEPYPTKNNPHQFKVPQSQYEQDQMNNKPNYSEMTNSQGYNLPQSSYYKPENNDDNKLHNTNQLTPAQNEFLPYQNEQNPFIQHNKPSYSQFKPNPSAYYTQGEQFHDAQQIIEPNQEQRISTLGNDYNPTNERPPHYQTQTSVTYVTHYNETDENSGQEPDLSYSDDTVGKGNISPDQDKKPRSITYITQINSTKYEYPFDNQYSQLDPIMFKVHQYPNSPNVLLNSKENENLYPTQTGLQPNEDNYNTHQLSYPEITQINQYSEFQSLYPTQYEKNKDPIISNNPQPGISPITISHPPRFAANDHDKDEAFMKNYHPGNPLYSQYKPPPFSTSVQNDENKGPLNKNTNNVSQPNNNTSSLFTTIYYPDIPGTMGALIDDGSVNPRFSQHYHPPPFSTSLHSDKNKGLLNKNPKTNIEAQPNRNISPLFTTKYYPDIPGTMGGALIDPRPENLGFDKYTPHPFPTSVLNNKNKGPLNKNPNTNNVSQPNKNISSLFTTKYYPDLPKTMGGALIDPRPENLGFDKYTPHPFPTSVLNNKNKGPLNKNPNTNNVSQPNKNISSLFTTKYYPDLPKTMGGALIDPRPENLGFDKYTPHPFPTSVLNNKNKGPLNKNPNTNNVSQPKRNTSPIFTTKYYPDVPGTMGALVHDRPVSPRFSQHYHPTPFSTSLQSDQNNVPLNKNPNTNHESQPNNNTSPLFTTKYYPDIPGTMGGALIDPRPEDLGFDKYIPHPFPTSIRHDEEKLPINKNPNTNIVSPPGLSPITNNNTSPLFTTKYYPDIPGTMGALVDDLPRNPQFNQNYHPPQLPISEEFHGNKEPLNKFPITFKGSNNDTDLGSFPNHNNSSPITLIPIGDPSTDQSYPVDDRGSSGGFQYVSHSAEDPNKEPGVFDDRGAHDAFQYISNSDENTESPKDGQLKPLSIDDLINQFDNLPNESPSTSPTVLKDPDDFKYKPRFKNVENHDNLINNPLYIVAKKLIDSPPSDDSMSDLDPLDLLPLLFPEITNLPFYKPPHEKNKFMSSPTDKDMPFLPVGDKEKEKYNSPLNLEQPTKKHKKNESPHNNAKNKFHTKSKSPLQNPMSGQPNKAANSLTTSRIPKNQNYETTTYPTTTQYPITESPRVVSKVAEEKRYITPPVRYPDVHIILHQRNEGEEISTPLRLDTDAVGQMNDVNEELGGPFSPKILHSRFRHRPKDQKEECGEGTQWLSNCHTCTCFAGKAMCYKMPDCTLKPFGEPMICKPYSQFKMGDCYSCECSGDGVAECDATECKTELNKETERNKDLDEFQLPVYNEFYDTEKTKELIQYYTFFKKLPKDTSSVKYPTCDPGTTWVSSCHQCECKESFTHECTKIDDCELDRELYGKPSQCKPNSKFYPKMNSMPCVECSCDDEGKSYCPLADHK